MSIERLRTAVGHVVLMFGVLVSIFPFYWMLVMASNTTPDIFTYPPKLLVGSHLFENMGKVLDNINFFGSMLLTLIAALAAVWAGAAATRRLVLGPAAIKESR